MNPYRDRENAEIDPEKVKANISLLRQCAIAFEEVDSSIKKLENKFSGFCVGSEPDLINENGGLNIHALFDRMFNRDSERVEIDSYNAVELFAFLRNISSFLQVHNDCFGTMAKAMMTQARKEEILALVEAKTASNSELLELVGILQGKEANPLSGLHFTDEDLRKGPGK
jgi:hypothetical protein